MQIESPKVVFNDNGRVTVTFRQHYRPDVVKASSTTKTLVMVKAGDKWLIPQEKAGSQHCESGSRLYEGSARHP